MTNDDKKTPLEEAATEIVETLAKRFKRLIDDVDMPYYTLDADHNPVMTRDPLEWGRWYEHPENRRVALTEGPNWRLSSICLGLDHGWTFEGPPVLFETMLFVDGSTAACWRFCTWDETAQFHAKLAAQYGTHKIYAKTDDDRAFGVVDGGKKD